MRRSARQLGLVLALAFVSQAEGARAEQTTLGAELSCAKIAGPGRIVCELRATTTSARLVWADALVVNAPAFARPLRSRVALQLEAGTSAASSKLALVGSAPGKGELTVLVRAVLCHGAPSGEVCRPETRRVTTEVEVGAPVPAPEPAPPAP